MANAVAAAQRAQDEVELAYYGEGGRAGHEAALLAAEKLPERPEWEFDQRPPTPPPRPEPSKKSAKRKARRERAKAEELLAAAAAEAGAAQLAARAELQWAKGVHRWVRLAAAARLYAEKSGRYACLTARRRAGSLGASRLQEGGLTALPLSRDVLQLLRPSCSFFDVGAAEWLLRLGDLRRVQEREEQEEREREEVGGPEPGEYDYDPDQGYARAVESDERWAECVEAALFSAGAGGGD